MQFMDTPPLPDPFKAATQRNADQVSQQESRLDQLKTALKEKGILLDYEYEVMMGTELKIWRATNKITNHTFSLDTADIETFITTGEPCLHDLLATVLALYHLSEERLKRLTPTEEAQLDGLTTSEKDILFAMLTLNAVDADHKTTAKSIFKKAIVSNPDAPDYHHFSNQLEPFALIAKVEGEQGKYLTTKGLKFATLLRGEVAPENTSAKYGK